MLTTFLVIALCVLLVWVYLKWISVKNFWSDRGVPYVPPHPILGNLTFLLQQNPAIWMREVYIRFKCPYVGMWLFWRPALIVNSPELGRNILIRDSANFRNKFMSTGTKDPIGSLSILFLKDPEWSNLRRRLSSAFTSAKLKSVQMVACSKSLDLIKRIKRDNDNGINLRMMFTDYTTDIFSISSFGIESDSTLTSKGAIRTITKDFMTFSLHRGISWCSIFFLPEIVDFFRFTFLPRQSTNTLRRIFKVILSQQNDDEPSKEAKNLLGHLLMLRKVTEEGKRVYSDDSIIAQAAVFLVGGFDTSGASLTFIVYQLAHAPDIQDRLYRELVAAKEKYGDGLDAIVSNNISYMDCIIKETLRLFPPMAWLDRVALEDYKVDDHLTIEAGTPVYVNGMGMHTDPEYFPDPYKFDPDRFLPENEANIKPYTYMPFGEGPRNCIGQRFAMIVLRCALAAIFLNYKIEPYPNSPKPLDVKIEKKGLFFFPGEDLKVNFIPRE